MTYMPDMGGDEADSDDEAGNQGGGGLFDTIRDRAAQARESYGERRQQAAAVGARVDSALDTAIGEPPSNGDDGQGPGVDFVGPGTDDFGVAPGPDSSDDLPPLDPAAGLGDDGGGNAGSLAPEAGLDDFGGGGPNSGLDLDPADIDPFEERR